MIIPIDGKHAESGIPGLRNAPSAEPRHLEQELIPFGERRVLRRIDFSQAGRPPLRLRKDKTYFGRGWTFQEFLFARRRLCFDNNSAWFQCCRDTVFEDHSHPRRTHDERDWILAVDYPSLTVYSSLAGDFNRRQLRYPQDCLSAMAGMLPCYEKVFTGGFLCGLPETFFDVAMLWHAASDLERRIPLKPASATGSPTTACPRGPGLGGTARWIFRTGTPATTLSPAAAGGSAFLSRGYCQ